MELTRTHNQRMIHSPRCPRTNLVHIPWEWARERDIDQIMDGIAGLGMDECPTCHPLSSHLYQREIEKRALVGLDFVEAVTETMGGLNDVIAELVDERDRARRWAARFEQELARLS